MTSLLELLRQGEQRKSLKNKADARRVLQEAELSASQTQLEREQELQQARRAIHLLEESQVGSGAPSFTPTLTQPSRLTPLT